MNSKWDAWIKGAKNINLARLSIQATYGEYLRQKEDVQHWVQMMSGQPEVPSDGVYDLSRLFLDHQLLAVLKA